MTNSIKTFADLDVPEAICRSLQDVDITHPFPIQELTLPLALSGADLIGQARTGTGKTLAFAIPLLASVDISRPTTQALVIVPTRELCLQVHDDVVSAGRRSGAGVVAAYGGKSIDPQSEAIARGAQIVVGTPGRLLDLRRRGLLDLSGVHSLVLDEADEMLDMGFLPDVEQLIEACSSDRQTLLFSATMPPEVVALARRYMNKPTFLRADVEEPRIAPETTQYFFSCHRMDKGAVVARILQTPDRGLCVCFTRTKRMADQLARELTDLGVNAAAIHSDLRQEARERALSRFRKGAIDVLCATEVAARGLDIDEVTHVVNYDCPDDEKMYLHRIGRTGRAGATGVAITLAVWNELARLEMIKKALDIDAETHEVFSTSPLLAELFDLPEGGRSESRRGAGAGTATKKPDAAVPKADEPAPRDRGAPQADEPAPRDRGAPQADEPAPGDRGAPPPEQTRQRRRTRRKVVAAESTAAAEAPAQRRGRSRRRTAEASPTRAATPPPQDEAASAPSAPVGRRADAGDGPTGAAERTSRTRRRVRRRRADTTDSVGERSERSAQDLRRPPTPAPPTQAEPDETGPTATRTRRGKRRQSQGNRRSRQSRPGTPAATTTGKQSDDATAGPAGDPRGAGKPALQRPMAITHLP